MSFRAADRVSLLIASVARNLLVLGNPVHR